MKKIAFLDYLRFCAIIAVIIIHCTPIDSMDFNSFEWKYNLPFNALSRFGVPLFFMISGALFLNPEKKTDFNYLKSKIVRIIICFFVFSLFYDILWYLNKYGFSLEREAILNVFIPNLITGKYHLWYLAAIISLYLLTPILKAFANDLKILKYYILILFIVCSVIPSLYHLLQLLGDYSFLETISQNMALNLPAYSIYFVLGYYLSNVSIERISNRIKILWLGIVFLLLFMISGDYVQSYLLKVPSIMFSGYLSPLTIVYSSLIFVIARIKIREKTSNIVVRLVANYSLGIYLIHALFIDFLRTFGFLPVRVLPLIVIPIIVVIVLLISMGATYIMKRINYFNRIL